MIASEQALAHLQQGHPAAPCQTTVGTNDVLYELPGDYQPFQEYIRPKG